MQRTISILAFAILILHPLAPCAAAPSINLSPADLSRILFIGGPLNLVCFTDTHVLGVLLDDQLQAGSAVKKLNSKKKLKSLRLANKKIRNKLRSVANDRLKKRLIRKRTFQRKMIFGLKEAMVKCRQGKISSSSPFSSSRSSNVSSGSSSSQTSAAEAFDGWRVLPIRSQEEYDLGRIGGEAEQHPHGISRSLSNPEVIYISHDVGQVWKSTNGGQSWKKTLGLNLPLNAGQSIAVDPANPDIVFLIVDTSWNWLVDPAKEGLYRSTDGGDTWQQVLSAENEIHRIYRHDIAYDPRTISAGATQRWYAAFPNKALYRSDNAGQDWTEVESLAGHSPVYQVKVNPGDGTVYVASGLGLFASSSLGANLQQLTSMPAGAVSSIEIDPGQTNRLYATLRDAGLYRSTNGGASFNLIRAFDAASVFLNPGHPQTLFLVGISSNTRITHDGGTSWIENMVTVPAPGLGRSGSSWKGRIAGEITGIVPNPQDPNEAVAFSRATLWRTTDGGRRFEDASTLFTGFAWSWWKTGIAFDRFNPTRWATFNCDVAVVTTNTNGDYFNLRNSGIWQMYTGGQITWIGSYSGDFQPIPDSQVMLASVGGYFRTQLMRSADEGRSWQLVTQGAEQEQQNLFVAFHPDDPYLVFAGNKVSYDAGQNFVEVDFGAHAGHKPSILGMCRSNPDTLYALDQYRWRVFRSDDRGVSWRMYHDYQSDVRFIRLDSLPTFAVDPLDCDKIYGMKNYDLAIYDGQSWRATGVLALAGGPAPGNFVRSVAVDPNNSSIIYAGLFAPGRSHVFRSVDAGYTWEDISYNLPRVGISALAINPHSGELLQGSAMGTWVLPPPYPGEHLIYGKAIPMPSCHDGLRNGSETGIDSGGECG